MRYTRRQFMEITSALATTSLLGLSPSALAEPPPEVKKIRLVKIPAICFAPEYVLKNYCDWKVFPRWNTLKWIGTLSMRC